MMTSCPRCGRLHEANTAAYLDARKCDACRPPDQQRLRVAVERLYAAGRWTCGLPADEEARLWEEVRDAAGIPPGTETARAGAEWRDAECRVHEEISRHVVASYGTALPVRPDQVEVVPWTDPGPPHSMDVLLVNDLIRGGWGRYERRTIGLPERPNTNRHIRLDQVMAAYRATGWVVNKVGVPMLGSMFPQTALEFSRPVTPPPSTPPPPNVTVNESTQQPRTRAEPPPCPPAPKNVLISEGSQRVTRRDLEVHP